MSSKQYRAISRVVIIAIATTVVALTGHFAFKGTKTGRMQDRI